MFGLSSSLIEVIIFGGSPKVSQGSEIANTVVLQFGESDMTKLYRQLVEHNKAPAGFTFKTREHIQHDNAFPHSHDYIHSLNKNGPVSCM